MAIVVSLAGRRNLLWLLLLFCAICTAINNARASSLGGAACPVGSSGLPEARALLTLVELLQQPGVASISVQQVFDAYKEYVHLYELQSDLASQFESKKVGCKMAFEDRYKLIGGVLSSAGIGLVAESLFTAFDEVDPTNRLVLTERLRTNIQEAIESSI